MGTPRLTPTYLPTTTSARPSLPSPVIDSIASAVPGLIATDGDPASGDIVFLLTDPATKQPYLGTPDGLEELDPGSVQQAATGKITESFTEAVERTIKGTKVKRDADTDNPAYLIEQDDGDRVLKSHSELRKAT